jgi:S-formylglutathione hydrolase FrmB
MQIATFTSSALGVQKRYLIYFPSAYDSTPNRRFPVVYLLHGTGGTERSWLDDIAVNVVLDSLTKVGSPEMIAVLVDGDNSYYHNWITSYDYNTCISKAEEKPASSYCVHALNYDTYITQDLVAHIDGTYRTKTGAQYRAVAGYSMGGYGAAYLGLAHPDVFGAIASLSGAWLSLLHTGTYPNQAQATTFAQLQTRYQDTISLLQNQYGTDVAHWRQLDPYSLMTSAKQSGGAIPALWLAVGTSDSRTLADNQIFNQAAVNLGVPITYTEGSGGHTTTFWRSREGSALAWIAGKIGQ